MLSLLGRWFRALRRTSPTSAPRLETPQPTAEQLGPVAILPRRRRPTRGIQKGVEILDDADARRRSEQARREQDIERAFHKDAQWRRGEGNWD